MKENGPVLGAGLSKSVQKEASPAELRQVAVNLGVQEGCDDGVRLVNEQLKAAKLADNVSLCSNKEDERGKTSVRVGSVQEKLEKVFETFGSCLDKAEEGVGAPTRVIMTQKTTSATVEGVGSSLVCTECW